MYTVCSALHLYATPFEGVEHTFFNGLSPWTAPRHTALRGLDKLHRRGAGHLEPPGAVRTPGEVSSIGHPAADLLVQYGGGGGAPPSARRNHTAAVPANAAVLCSLEASGQHVPQLVTSFE